MALFSGLVQQLLQQANQPSSVSKPEYTNFYTTPGEKLNIEQGNNINSGTFYVTPDKPLDIVSGREFKSKGGLIKGYPKLAKKGWK
jgi:hypothetical protein